MQNTGINEVNFEEQGPLTHGNYYFQSSPGRFNLGEWELEYNNTISNGVVKGFSEKDPQASGWINGGFFCLDKEIENYLMGDDVSFESDPINKIVSENQLSAYEHSGWWQPMDTLREKIILQELWLSGKAPWII